MADEFEIRVSFQEDFDEEVVDDFLSLVNRCGVSAKKQKRELSAYMSIEWAIPTLVVAYLAKPYFDGFLKEAGKDHYQLLKIGFRKFAQKVVGKSGNFVITASSSHKIPKQLSLLFSVQATTLDGTSLKFCFPIETTPNTILAQVDKLHNLMLDHFSEVDGGKLSLMMQAIPDEYPTRYLKYSAEAEEWKLIDRCAEIKKLADSSK